MATIRRTRKAEVSVQDSALARQVAAKAYELWEKRGRPHGSDRQDWFEAERLVQGPGGEKATF